MGYNFSDALELAKAGNKVRRNAWPAAWLHLAVGGPADGPEKVYLVEKQPGEEEKASLFVARNAELMANDWDVVVEAAEPAPPGPETSTEKPVETEGAGAPPAAEGEPARPVGPEDVGSPG